MSFQGVRYRISELCDLVKTNTAAVLSTYEDDIFMPGSLLSLSTVTAKARPIIWPLKRRMRFM